MSWWNPLSWSESASPDAGDIWSGVTGQAASYVNDLSFLAPEAGQGMLGSMTAVGIGLAGAPWSVLTGGETEAPAVSEGVTAGRDLTRLGSGASLVPDDSSLGDLVGAQASADPTGTIGRTIVADISTAIEGW